MKYSKGLKLEKRPNGSYDVVGKGACFSRHIVIPPTINDGKCPVRQIYDKAFAVTRIKSVVIPEGITTIRESAFQACKKLTKVKLPDSLARIENDAFENSGVFTIEEIWKDDLLIIDGWIIGCRKRNDSYHIPYTVKGIADGAFDEAKGYNKIPNPNYKEEKSDYDYRCFQWSNWYHCPGMSPGPHPGEEPKEFFIESIPIKIEYEGTLSEWETLFHHEGKKEYPFEIVSLADIQTAGCDTTVDSIPKLFVSTNWHSVA